jgi:hypothetical protein
MRLGRDDAPDGVKSVLSGLPWPLAAMMPVTLRSCSKPDHEGWPKPNAQFAPLGPPSFGDVRDRQRPKISGQAVRRSFAERQQRRRFSGAVRRTKTFTMSVNGIPRSIFRKRTKHSGTSLLLAASLRS